MLFASSTSKGMDPRETLAPVPVTEMESEESKQPWDDQDDESRGEKRKLPDSDKKIRIPITEKQLTILKKRAQEIINRLDEILDLEFVKEIEKKHVSNFISARGDMRHFLKRETTGADQPSWPRNKRPRRARSENTRTTWLGVPVRRQGRGSLAPSWPRPSPSWSRGSEPSMNFSRGFRSNAARGRGPRSNAQRPNSARNRRPRKFREDLYSRCELCNVELCGEASVKQHMAGRRHREALEAQAAERSPVDQEREVNDQEHEQLDKGHDVDFPEQELVREGSAPVMHEINIGDED